MSSDTQLAQFYYAHSSVNVNAPVDVLFLYLENALDKAVYKRLLKNFRA